MQTIEISNQINEDLLADLDENPPAHFMKWPKEIFDIRAQVLKVPADYNPYATAPGTKSFIGVSQNNERARQIIECTAIKLQAMYRQKLIKDNTSRKADNIRDIVRGKVVHIDQSLSWTQGQGELQCLTQNSHIFLFGHDLVLPGELHFRLQGYPSDMDWTPTYRPRRRLDQNMMKKASLNTMTRKMMGEGFCAPSACVAHAALFMVSTCPWWSALEDFSCIDSSSRLLFIVFRREHCSLCPSSFLSSLALIIVRCVQRIRHVFVVAY